MERHDFCSARRFDSTPRYPLKSVESSIIEKATHRKSTDLFFVWSHSPSLSIQIHNRLTSASILFFVHLFVSPLGRLNLPDPLHVFWSFGHSSHQFVPTFLFLQHFIAAQNFSRLCPEVFFFLHIFRVGMNECCYWQRSKAVTTEMWKIESRRKKPAEL